MKFRMSVLVILLAILQVNAQNTGSVSGTVTNKNNSAPLGGITVKLVSTDKATVTDSAGRFRITGIPVKAYTIQFSGLGYADLLKYNINITTGN